MTDYTLQPNQPPLELRDLGFVITAQNLAAQVSTQPGSAPGSRSGGQGLTPAVLKAADIKELGTVMLQDQHPQRDQAKQVSLHVPAGGSDEGRLLLYFDENGGVTIHLPQAEQRPPAGLRAGGNFVRFDVPIRKPAPPAGEAAQVRGVGGVLAKMVLKVIGWRVAGAVARQVGPPLVRRWEAQQRPMRALGQAHLFEPQAGPLETPIPPAERALLFIHGTFSRVATAFQGIGDDADLLARLNEHYGDQIYGFDHATLATGVATNVMQLYEKLGPGLHHFDIICHSRGGLVARTLRDLSQAQLQERFVLDARRGKYEADLEAWGQSWRIPEGVQVNVKRILFVGTPNNGTILAQPTHLKKYLETLLTAANLLPEFVDVTVDAILTTAKLLLSEVVPELPGLDDQKPGSSLIELLNNTPAAQDAAIEADYEPPLGLQAIMRGADLAIDFIFGQEQNDLIVPTAGVSQWLGGLFAPERRLAFSAERSVHHCNIFAQPETRQNLWRWLSQD